MVGRTRCPMDIWLITLRRWAPRAEIHGSMAVGMATTRGGNHRGKGVRITTRLDAGELGEGQREIGAGVEAAQGGAHAVDGEGFVVEDGVVEGFGVVERGGEGGPGGFGVVEGDDEDRVGVGEGAVPEVVVGGVADGEAAAVEGEEGWEEGRGG